MDKKKILEYALEEAKNGKDFGEIRSDLSQFGLADKEVTEIIKYVDNQLMNDALRGSVKSHKREYFLVGCFLLIIGLFITLGTYLGIISMGNSYLISYGPIIAGLGLIVTNRSNR
ncbi:hypothetical protein [Roseivirga misakiensis]|uniref:Uncharacterized protein n=1 Tax=Roseivirga misakiensis TaxID=1563681 RepID=A0A1E5T0L5_9BACT|nr:hypothetical protein [Roseivirga misakiensis]OEK04914.1 hypothetical protein BFP71_15880 [Roseivirga misakiensis]